MQINTYLTFQDNCRQAFEFYRSVFGGEFTDIQSFRDGPPDMGVAEAELDLLMHVSLPMGSGVLMGSDRGSFGPPLATGNNFSLSIQPDSKEEADSLFAKLSDGGQVTMPMQDVFWGSYYGMCTDKFGINWMINCMAG